MAKYTKGEREAIRMGTMGGIAVLFLCSGESGPLGNLGGWVIVPAGLLFCAGIHMEIEEGLFRRKEKRPAAERAKAPEGEKEIPPSE